jgi:hypothetical protein
MPESSSLAKKTAKDLFFRPDASWVKLFPRIIFTELYIAAAFYAPGQELKFVENCFQFIRSGKSNTALDQMLVGGSSAFEMAHSPLALYESQESFSPNSGWKYVLDPQLSKNITKETKEFLKQDSAKKVQATVPNPQFIRRIESRSSLGVSFDAEVYEEHGVPVSFESTCEAIADAGTVHAVALAYEPIHQQIFDRIKGKTRSVLSSKKNNEGLSEFVGSRGVSLFTIKEQKQWISVQLLSNSVRVYNPSLERNPSIDPLFDAHVMIPHVNDFVCWTVF